jgi:hypothetical protein
MKTIFPRELSATSLKHVLEVFDFAHLATLLVKREKPSSRKAERAQSMNLGRAEGFIWGARIF